MTFVEETITRNNLTSSSLSPVHSKLSLPGITRLNVYAGMAGFYFVRDEMDTGKQGNPLNLPAFPYELPLVIQDRMFKENGELFYPAFPGDPYCTFSSLIWFPLTILPGRTFLIEWASFLHCILHSFPHLHGIYRC